MVLRLRSHGWLIGVLAVAAFVMLFRLGAQPIQNWDEGIHGAVSLEMIEDGDWLTPHYMGGPYFRKPPLKLWMSGALFDWFGANAWTLRLPSALAGIATSLLVAWWMWQWRRNRLDAFLAGVIVATMRPIFFHGFRTGEMDGLLTFWVILAMYAWWRAVEYPSPTHSPSRWEGEKKRGWWFALCGAAIGLAVMTKSAAGLLPIPIILAHAVVTGIWRRIRVRDVLVLVLAVVAIAAPWHLAMTVLYGTQFWNYYIGWHVIERIATALHNEGTGAWWYLPTLAKKFTPYTFWLIPAFAFPLIHARRQRWSTSPLTALLSLWIAVTLALFTIAKTKFDWYLLPLYPAAVMLLVPFLSSARDVIANRWIAALHLIAIAAFALALPDIFPDGTITDRIVEQWYALFGHPTVLAALAVVTVAGAIVATYHRWSIRVAGRVAYAIVLALILIPGFTVTARHLRAREPNGPFSAIAAAVQGNGGTLVAYGFDLKQHPAGYFILRNALRNDVRILDGQFDVRRTLGMLTSPNRPGFLLTQNGTELPEELRAAVANSRIFDGFTLWRRR